MSKFAHIDSKRWRQKQPIMIIILFVISGEIIY